MKWNRSLFWLLALSLLASGAEARALRYFPHKLFELAAGADLVVAGTIREVHLGKPRAWSPSSPPGTFQLEVEKVITGTPPKGSLEVACFEDWACAKRWAPYAPGQRVLLFLAAPKQGSQSYQILSGGGEGEMPLLEDSVVARGYRIEGRDGCRIVNYEAIWPRVDGIEVLGALVPLAELSDAVRGFREVYAWENIPRIHRPLWIRPKQSLEQAEEFARSSKTTQHLHREVIRSDAWKRQPPTGR